MSPTLFRLFPDSADEIAPRAAAASGQIPALRATCDDLAARQSPRIAGGRRGRRGALATLTAVGPAALSAR